MLRAVRRSPANPRTWAIRWHLWRCAECRDRVNAAEKELFRLFAPQQHALDGLAPSEEESRQRLMRSIRAAATQPSAAPERPRNLASPHALLATGLVTAVLLAAYFVAGPLRRPAITADSILVRAVEMEAAGESSNGTVRPGVIYAKLEVRSGARRWEWPVYRDTQGRRKPKLHTASLDENALVARLAEAGVSRENPLSIASFQSWRDRLGPHDDRVQQAASGSITVTTSVPDKAAGPVREETLTLRSGDYHPLVRTVAFRDEQTVEIAEVDYRVLDWDHVDAALFESASEPAPLPAVHTSRAAFAAAPPSREGLTLSEPELNLAELRARLLLAREDADVNEQIELSSRPDGVVVHGLVSTQERKLELQAALAQVPHVVVQLSTPAERETSEPGPPGLPAQGSLKLAEAVSSPSPLLLYWKSHHGGDDGFSQASFQVLDSGLRISQQSHALRILAEEFQTKAALEDSTKDAYTALWRAHEEKLRAALADEARILRTLDPTLPMGAAPHQAQRPASAEELERMSSVLLQLSRELIGGEDSGQRDAQPILADLAQETERISNVLMGLPAGNN